MSTRIHFGQRRPHGWSKVIVLGIMVCGIARVAAAASDESMRMAPLRGQPQLPEPTYIFDGSALREVRFDRNGDSVPERREVYGPKGLIAVEFDPDGDGTVDMRFRYNAPWFLMQVTEIDGQFRIVPVEMFPPSNLRTGWRGLVFAEKLVEGEWTGTFSYTEAAYLGTGPLDEPRTQTTVWTFSEGQLVRRVRTGGMDTAYERIEFEDGMPVWSFIGPAEDRIRKEITWKNNRHWREQEDMNLDGTMDIRREYDLDAPWRIKTEKRVDGGWSGTFEKKAIGPVNGHQCVTVRSYVDGYTSSVASIRESDGAVMWREIYRDGYKVGLESDRDGDGVVDLRQRFKAQDPWWPAQTLCLRDGEWTGDFVLKNETGRSTYVGGWLARTESGGDRDGDGEYDYLIVYVSDRERRSGKNGKVDTWHYYSDKRQLVREARDLDGDEKPDLFADYVTLTIEHRPSNPVDDTRPGS